MRIQDILFIIIFIPIFLLRKSRVSLTVGLLFLLFSMVLFSQWVFYTGERLTWYGVGCILLAIIQILFQKENNDEKNK